MKSHQAGAQVRLVTLHQSESNPKLGFSLRGGKELTGSSVGVFVSHVERASEADRKGLRLGDRLIQVNGLDVNLATYEQVIDLIKEAPKSNDIILKVTNFGKIPFQERSGDPIRWIQLQPISPAGKQALSLSSSDDGIANCERSTRSTEWACSEGSALDDSAVSSTLTSSSFDEEDHEERQQHISSASSLSSLDSRSSLEGSSETLVRVPGGRRTSETFGCGVVKGPDEWPGIFVQHVKAGSLAERVGLELGDQLVRAGCRSLDELSFEDAIRLIKRLQQQQDQLVLHVRKGAALRYLASRQRSQRQNLAEAKFIPKQAASEAKLETTDDASISVTENQLASKQALPTSRDKATSLHKWSSTPAGKSDLAKHQVERSHLAGGITAPTSQQSSDSPKSESGVAQEKQVNQLRQQSISGQDLAITKKLNSGESKQQSLESESIEHEEIRIVSQNCKLHHKPSHKFNSSQLVHEMFPHPAAKMQPMQQHHQRAQPAVTRRQIVLASKRRQLEPRPAIIQRYMSMENLASDCQQTTRSSSVSRLPGTLCQVDERFGYSQPIGLTSKQPPRFYRRSNSVLGHCDPQALSCAGCSNESAYLAAVQTSKALRCFEAPANDARPVRFKSNQPARCCQIERKSRYTSSLVNSMALSRARSMDKLNLSLNYSLGPSSYTNRINSKSARMANSMYRARDFLDGNQLCCPNYALPVIEQPPVCSYAAPLMSVPTLAQRARPRRLSSNCCSSTSCKPSTRQGAVYRGAKQLIFISSTIGAKERSSGCCAGAATRSSSYSQCCIADYTISDEYSCIPQRCCPSMSSAKPIAPRHLEQKTVYSATKRLPKNSKHAGSATDSSGYLSANERLQPSLRQSPKLSEQPAPPPPPTIKGSGGHRDTRRQLTTFSASNTPQAVQQASSSGLSSSSYSSSSCSSDSSLVETSSTSPTSYRPVLLGHQTHRDSSRRAEPIPCPPPLPLDDELSDDLKLEPTGRKSEQKTPSTKTKLTLANDNNDRDATKPSKAKPNLLCFVDELKELAQRQHQLPNSSHQDSSTLIKIINASRSAKQRCCGACPKSAHRNSARGCDEASCSKSSHPIVKQHECKSVKLNSEDNKRRQHEMLMKEFKFAHSKMFSKRKNNNPDEEQANPVTDKVVSARTTTLIEANKISLLPQSPVHLAAAN